MTRGLATLDRLITLIIGLLLLAAGTLFVGIYFGEPHIMDVVSYARLEQWPDAYEWEYLTPTLIGGTILAALIGLWLISMNLRRRRISRMNSTANSGLGTIVINVDNIADAMADSVEQLPKVTRAHAKVVTDRKVKTLELTVTADPTIDIGMMTQHIEQQEAAFRAAIRDIDVASSYRIHLGPVDHQAI